jgi:DNA-binding NarL/FixJ family response regulator
VIEDPADDEFIVRTLLHVLADCPSQHAQQKKVPAGDPIDNAFHDGLIDDFDNRILCLLAAGGTNEEIAEALHYSNQTIRNRVSDLLKLLNLRNRTELSSAWSQYLYSKAMRDN